MQAEICIFQMDPICYHIPLNLSWHIQDNFQDPRNVVQVPCQLRNAHSSGYMHMKLASVQTAMQQKVVL